MNANRRHHSRWALCFVGFLFAGASAATAVEVPSYIGFVSHNSALPNPDRPYEMVSGTVNYLPSSTFSLYDLKFEASNPAQLDVPNRNAAGVWEFDSQFDVKYQAVVSFSLEPPHPISGFGRAHAVGRATEGQWPFEPLVYDTELVALDLFGLSPIPEAMIRESPSLRSSGVTVVEDLCPLCLGPVPRLRISSFFDVFTELTLGGGDWSPASESIRAAQYRKPTTPGDYNSNGAVDAADYVIWRDNVQNDFSLPNDDTPGVGQDDYTRWRANFGATAGEGSASSVPEPGTLLLSMLAGCFTAMLLRKPFPTDPAT